MRRASTPLVSFLNILFFFSLSPVLGSQGPLATPGFEEGSPGQVPPGRTMPPGDLEAGFTP